MGVEAILGSILANYATMGLAKAVRFALKEYTMKTGNTTIEHKFPKSYTGRVLVQIRNLKSPTKVLLKWGDYHAFVDLLGVQNQFIVLDKRHEDENPLSVAVEAKCKIEFFSDVVNASDTDAVKWYADCDASGSSSSDE